MEELKNFDISLLSVCEKLAGQFSLNLSSKDIVFLEGPLGAGKTQWVKFCLKSLGCSQRVISPSFNIHQRYRTQKGVAVDHLDLYRIQNEEDLESIGFFDLFLKKEGIIFIEWADKLSDKILYKGWRKHFLHFYWESSRRFLSID